jgi:hypothetical protein
VFAHKERIDFYKIDAGHHVVLPTRVADSLCAINLGLKARKARALLLCQSMLIGVRVAPLVDGCACGARIAATKYTPILAHVTCQRPLALGLFVAPVYAAALKLAIVGDILDVHSRVHSYTQKK